MIKAAFFLKISFLSFLGIFNEPVSLIHTNNIRIVIPNIRSDKGEILIAIYNKANGFPENSTLALQTAKMKAKKGSQSYTLNGLAHGKYAIALLHDENGDGKMNKNMLGIPKEGYGVSNNVKNLMSAPAFKDAVFSHTQETELSIELNY